MTPEREAQMRGAFEATHKGFDLTRDSNDEYVHGSTSMLWNEWLACARALEPKWMPIESAPKDGSTFLAWIDGKSDFFHWQSELGNRPVGWRDSFIYVYPEGDKNGPTHWMPLPAQPNAAMSAALEDGNATE